MELAQVKAAVKQWEKVFKSSNGRQPTKDDIKADPSGIAEHYALYRRLSKSSDSQSQSQHNKSIPPSSSSTTASESKRSERTPTRPAPEYPTTPTPPARRTGLQSLNPPSALPNTLSNGTKATLKRTASKASLAQSPPHPAASSSRMAFITPKKSKPEAPIPIRDSNPLNPFSTPTKSSSSRLFPTSSASASTSSITTTTNHTGLNDPNSPFIHFSSPQKLKEMLVSNSVKKLKARESNQEITPRTKARKRLRGEQVDDTPVKDKPTRRRRGQGRVEEDRFAGGINVDHASEGSAHGLLGSPGLDEEDDEFGPSPLKPGLNESKRYESLFEQNEFGQKKATGVSTSSLAVPKNEKPNGKEKEKRRPSEMGFFGRSNLPGKSTKDKTKTKDAILPSTDLLDNSSATSSPTPIPAEIPSTPPAIPSSEDTHPPSEDILPPPSPDPMLEEAAAQPTPSRRSTRPQKVLELSDDEPDEWDPEGGTRRQRVVIVPTRGKARRPKAFGGFDDDFEDDVVDQEEDIDDDHPDPEEIEEDGAGGSESPSAVDTNRLAPPLLSLLSLQSPSKKSREKLTALRVRAIFDPAGTAKEIEAFKKGQDVYVSGEGVGMVDEAQEEEEVLLGFGGGVDQHDDAEVGDDDWESEDEGWKRSTLGIEDEGDW